MVACGKVIRSWRTAVFAACVNDGVVLFFFSHVRENERNVQSCVCEFALRDKVEGSVLEEYVVDCACVCMCVYVCIEEGREMRGGLARLTCVSSAQCNEAQMQFFPVEPRSYLLASASWWAGGTRLG